MHKKHPHNSSIQSAQRTGYDTLTRLLLQGLVLALSSFSQAAWAEEETAIPPHNAAAIAPPPAQRVRPSLPASIMQRKGSIQSPETYDFDDGLRFRDEAAFSLLPQVPAGASVEQARAVGQKIIAILFPTVAYQLVWVRSEQMRDDEFLVSFTQVNEGIAIKGTFVDLHFFDGALQQVTHQMVRPFAFDANSRLDSKTLLDFAQLGFSQIRDEKWKVTAQDEFFVFVDSMPHLVRRFSGGKPDQMPDYDLYVDALSGEPLLQRNLFERVTTGRVMASRSVGCQTGTKEMVPVPRVHVGSGVFTDEEGFFVAGAGQERIQTNLTSIDVPVAGDSSRNVLYPTQQSTLTPGIFNSVTLNQPQYQLDASINILRFFSWLYARPLNGNFEQRRSNFIAYSVAGSPPPDYCPCNAYFYYAGTGGLTFCAAGNMGPYTCPYTGSTPGIVYHEAGHALTCRLHTDCMSSLHGATIEGLADIAAFLVDNSPDLRWPFNPPNNAPGCAGVMRTANNTYTYGTGTVTYRLGSSNDSRAFHNVGQVLSGLWFSFKRALIARYQDEGLASSIASQIFVRHMYQTKGDMFQNLQPMMLADVRSSLVKPPNALHACEINQAFYASANGKPRFVGIPGMPAQPAMGARGVSASFRHTPVAVRSSNADLVVNLDVIPNAYCHDRADLPAVRVYFWSSKTGAAKVINMTKGNGNTFTANLGKFADGTEVLYGFSATFKGGTITHPYQGDVKGTTILDANSVLFTSLMGPASVLKTWEPSDTGIVNSVSNANLFLSAWRLGAAAEQGGDAIFGALNQQVWYTTAPVTNGNVAYATPRESVLTLPAVTVTPGNGKELYLRVRHRGVRDANALATITVNGRVVFSRAGRPGLVRDPIWLTDAIKLDNTVFDTPQSASKTLNVQFRFRDSTSPFAPGYGAWAIDRVSVVARAPAAPAASTRSARRSLETDEQSAATDIAVPAAAEETPTVGISQEVSTSASADTAKSLFGCASSGADTLLLGAGAWLLRRRRTLS